MEFSREERIAIVTLGAAAGLIVGFDELVSISGSVITFDYTTGLLTTLVLMAGMIASVYWHELGHKFAARWTGYYTHIATYPPGILLGVVLAVFSFGWIQFFTPNVADLEANPRARIAKHRKYENWKQEAFIAGAGIFATALLAVALQLLFLVTGAGLFKTLLLGNLWLMLYSLIPFELLNLLNLKLLQKIDQLPQSDGLYLLHYSKYAFIFATTFVIVTAAILYVIPHTFSLATVGLFLLVPFALALIATLSVWWRFFKEMK